MAGGCCYSWSTPPGRARELHCCRRWEAGGRGASRVLDCALRLDPAPTGRCSWAPRLQDGERLHSIEWRRGKRGMQGPDHQQWCLCGETTGMFRKRRHAKAVVGGYGSITGWTWSTLRYSLIPTAPTVNSQLSVSSRYHIHHILYLSDLVLDLFMQPISPSLPSQTPTSSRSRSCDRQILRHCFLAISNMLMG